MGDAIAHLTGADNSDTLNIDCHVLFRSMRSPGSWLRIRLISVLSLHVYDVLPHDAIARSGKIATWSTLDLIKFRSQLRQGLVEIGHKTVVGHLEDRRLLIFIDCNNDLGVFHSCEMLNRT